MDKSFFKLAISFLSSRVNITLVQCILYLIVGYVMGQHLNWIQFIIVFLITFFYNEILAYFNCTAAKDQLLGISSNYYIYLLYVIPLVSIYYLWKLSKFDGSIKTSSVELLKGTSNNYYAWINHLLFASKLLALGLFIRTRNSSYQLH